MKVERIRHLGEVSLGMSANSLDASGELEALLSVEGVAHEPYEDKEQLMPQSHA